MSIVILLIVIGLLLFVVEFLLIPGISVAGIGGVVFITTGIVIAYVNHGPMAGHLTLLGTVVATVLTLYFALRSQTWRKFKLKASISSTVEGKIEEGQIKPGDSGIAISRLAPMGKARINEMVVEAKSLGDYIDQKSEVVVVKIEDNKVIVKPKN